MIIYDGKNQKVRTKSSEYNLFCGEVLDETAVILIKAIEGDISLQEAFTLLKLKEGSAKNVWFLDKE